MNREIQDLREVITKLVPMLTGKGLKVTQRGSNAYVEANPKTNKPEVVNIPSIPDDAPSEFIEAVSGFIDHEVGHVLFTDWKLYGGNGVKIDKFSDEGKALVITHNLVEDTYVERMIVKTFPGSASNLERLHNHFLTKITAKAIKSAAGDEKREFDFLMVPMIRALSGQEIFQKFMDDGGYWNQKYIKNMVMALSDEALERLKTAKSTEDTLFVAQEIHDILFNRKQKQEEEENEQKSKKSKDKPDKKAGSGNGTGKRDHSESSGEESQSTGEDGQSSGSGSSADPEKSSRSGGKSSDKEDEGENEKENEGGSSDKSQDDDGESGKNSDDEDGEEKDEKADDESDDPSESSSGVAEEDDAEGDDGDEGGSEESENGDEEGESSVGESEKDDIEGSKTFGNDEESSGGGGAGGEAGKSMFDIDPSEYSPVDLSSAIANEISEMATKAISKADYTAFTKDEDKIEVFDTDRMTIADNWIPDLDEKVGSMVGPMQKEIERMMAAQSYSVNTAGHRSGRLHSPSLYRVLQGDARVFQRREIHSSKDTAVTLLIDNSGSMYGSRIVTAMEAAYVLGQTLERVNIASEILGFTTGYLSNKAQMQANNDKCRFDRYHTIVMPIFKQFNERMSPVVKKRIVGQMHHQVGMNTNTDGESLQYAAARLAPRREARKVLLVLSDGQPVGSNSGGHLKGVVDDLNKSGIETIGIGIQTNAVRSYYDRSLVLNRVEDLPSVVMGELKRILTK